MCASLQGGSALGFWLWAFGFGLLALGFWLWAFGFGLLALGFWLCTHSVEAEAEAEAQT